MGLEAASFISQLDAANPLGTDQKGQGDDHLRLIKAVLLATLPNFNAALTATPAQIAAAIAAVNALPVLDANLHAPVVTAVFNCTVTSPGNHIYHRIGSYVFVVGRVAANPTTATAFGFRVTLPIASNLAAFTDLFGIAVGFSAGGVPVQGVVQADAGNDNASVQFDAPSVNGNSTSWHYFFGYRII